MIVFQFVPREELTVELTDVSAMDYYEIERCAAVNVDSKNKNLLFWINLTSNKGLSHT